MTGNITDRQRAFFRSGKTLSVQYRKEHLKSLYSTISDMEDEIAAALEADLGKSRTEGYMCEIGLTLSEIRHAIRNIGRYSRRRRVATPLAQFHARSYIIPEPYGNVLIMSPWNYPFLLCISPLASAIAAGNTAIVKPSAYSPATSAVIKKLVSKVFPEEYATVAEGGRDVNSSLLEQKFDYIFFTGSKSVGRIVMEKAARHLTPVTLELGGKSPVIVDRTADLHVAATRIVFGKYLNCGQTCVAPDYILVHESIKDAFVEECRNAVASMFGENPSSNPSYGKIINEKHFLRLNEALKEAAGHPETRIVCGGESFPDTLKINPAIVELGRLGDRGWESLQLMKDEIFGPIMPVIAYSEISDAVQYIDSCPRPLATYIFTSDCRLKKQLLKELHFGGGCVNDTIIHLATDRMPFGGVGESGMGHYHGKYGFETFSHLKSIVEKSTWIDLPMRYQPYTGFKERLIRMFLK